MTEPKLIDHLFRHQFGKMVSILTRIFGLEHLQTIEDAVQDTFVTAMRAWQNGMPDNPEAWLTQAAKNRTLDLFRKLSAEQTRLPKLESGPETIALNELFLDHEIADSQLRMIFTACNPLLSPKDQIAFSLKTISGFSQKEIAAALLVKEETIKKRLARARNSIQKAGTPFEIPSSQDLPERISRVLEVLYLIFNEGFHSGRKELLLREDLCGEAMRLCHMMLQNEHLEQPATHALFALMCFNVSRLRGKVNEENEVVSISQQDRSLWDDGLIATGHKHMDRAVETPHFTSYHYEAAIAAEHVMAPDYESTNWANILKWYQQLERIQPSLFNGLNMAVIYVQLEDFEPAKELLNSIDPAKLEQRAYLYHGLWAEYYHKKGEKQAAVKAVERAIEMVNNEGEKRFLQQKRDMYLTAS